MVAKPKVFGIGFHKTGTSSLARALTLLGYNVTGMFGVHNRNLEAEVESKALSLVDSYNAFQDNPWPILYKALDSNVPNSKFILTIRPTEQWLTSVVRHFGGKSTAMREWIYGVGDPVGNEDIYVTRYERHNAEVIDYFNDRADQLLIMNLSNGDGWEELCPFLSIDIPEVDFPHENKVTGLRKIRAMIRSIA